MNIKQISLVLVTGIIATTTFAQQGDPKLTEVYTPVPKVVTPGKVNSDAPSDAIILFGGKNRLSRPRKRVPYKGVARF